LDLRGRKWLETGEDCIMRSFVTCTFHQILFGEMRWLGQVTCMGDMRNADKILVGKPDRKRPRERPRRRWEDNIRMDLRKIGWKGVDFTHLAQDRDPVVECGSIK